MCRKKKLAVLSGLLAFALVGCSAGAAPELMDSTVVVETTAISAGTLSSDSTYIGTISAEGTAQVVTQVSGAVEELYVSVGDTVSPGQALCQLDDTSAQLGLQNARASYSRAQAGLNSASQSYQSAAAGYGGSGSLSLLEEQVRMAEETYAATQALFEIGAVAQVEVDQAYMSVESAKAGLQAAQSSLGAAQAGTQQASAGVDSARVGVSSAEHQLSLYHLTAPIGGVVEAVNVTKNNFASGGTVAFVISDAKNKTVTFYVTDAVYQNLNRDQRAVITARGQTYAGAITEISGIVDAATGFFKVKAVVSDAGDLPDGLKVEISTASHRTESAMLIPCDALYFENGDAYVYVARDGIAARTPVTLGLYTPEQAAIESGLAPGDEIITTWSAVLKDGSPIRLADDTPKDAPLAGEEEEVAP